MFAARISPAIVALTLLCAGVGTSRAQYDNSCCDPCWSDPDYRFFEPTDLDLNCMVPRKECGLTFRYDRLTWAIAGERATIGKAGLTVLSEEILRQNPLDEGTLPPQYTISNGIINAPPFAHFAGGDRYEFGYFDGADTWTVGILDGPDVSTYRKYGFNELDIPGTLPLVTQLDLRRDNNPVTDPNFDTEDGWDLTFGLFPGEGFLPIVGSADVPVSRFGWGSIHVNFETPPGLLQGWRDYNNLGSQTIQGPGYTVVMVETEVDGETFVITDITINRGVDGVIDDIDGDGIQGFVILTDDDDNVIAVVADYDDLHEFNVRFERLDVRNVTQVRGVELMWTHELSNRHHMAKHQNNRFEIGFGARFFWMRDRFTWDGRGDWIGHSFAETRIDNQIVGPQIRAKWRRQKGKWGLGIDGRFVAGYNITDFDQQGAVGENLNPGGLNSPVFFQPTAFASGKQENHFSPLVELRVEGTYQITSSMLLRAGYNATFIDNLTRASQVVHYRLPDMGLLEGGQNTAFINGVDLGFEINY